MGVSPSLQQAKVFGMGTQVAIVISTLRGHKTPKLLRFFSLSPQPGNCFGLNNNKDSRPTFLEPFPDSSKQKNRGKDCGMASSITYNFTIDNSSSSCLYPKKDSKTKLDWLDCRVESWMFWSQYFECMTHSLFVWDGAIKKVYMIWTYSSLDSNISKANHPKSLDKQRLKQTRRYLRWYHKGKREIHFYAQSNSVKEDRFWLSILAEIDNSYQL